MKKIIYHIGDISHPGGMERIVVLKANWLAEHGYDVTLLSKGASCKAYFPLSPKVKCEKLGCIDSPIFDIKRNFLGVFKSLYWSIKTRREHERKLKAYLMKHPCDYFITLLNRRFIPKLKDGSKKYFEIHFSQEAKYAFARTCHGVYKYVYLLGMWYQENNYKNYDKFIVLTERDKSLRGNMDNIVVIPNFITVVPPNKMPNYSKASIISVGRLDLPKGYEYLFKAMGFVCKKHPTWKLHIYGHSYGREEYYNNLIKEAGVEGNVFIHQPVSNIQEKYVESSFYVMSSIYEGFPLCLGEAMACGLTCVSYDCNCGPSEIIKDGEDGIIVKEVANVEKLAEAILYMIEHPEKRKEFGEKAQENIQRFSVDEVMKKWVKLLQ